VKKLALIVPVLVFVAACANPNPTPLPPTSSSSATPTAAPASTQGTTFGAAIVASTPFVALADLLHAPNDFEGKRVRTRGEIVAVCQNAGCWADLRPEGATAPGVPVHVTMHNHAFFLPKTSKTKLADVEGVVSVRTLTQEECDHFNSEGASLTAGSPVLGVDALGVALNGS
jgi:hypothetical protein